MLASRSSFLILLSLITTSITNVNAEPVRAKRLLFPRQNSSFGGWGLRMINCPAETQKCPYNNGCCPKDMVCITNSLMGGLACCPTKESCAEVIETLPVCPDPSWTLWQNADQHPFCCLPGQFGYQTAPGTFGPGSSCADSGMPVASSLLASSLVPAQGSGSATATGTARSSATTTRARSSTTATPGSSEVDPAGASSETAGGGSSPTIPASSGSTAKSGLSTGAIAGIGAAAGIIGLALIAGGVWWGFKKGQQKGREGQAVVENFIPAPEYTVGGGGDGTPGAVGVGAGAHEKPDGTVQAAEVYGTDGRRVEMQA